MLHVVHNNPIKWPTLGFVAIDALIRTQLQVSRPWEPNDTWDGTLVVFIFLKVFTKSTPTVGIPTMFVCKRNPSISHAHKSHGLKCWKGNIVSIASITHVKGQLSSMPWLPMYISCFKFHLTPLSHAVYYISCNPISHIYSSYITS